MVAFKKKNLDDFKTEIELLCLEVELLDEQTKDAVIKHLEETIDVLKLGRSEPPNKKIKLEEIDAVNLKLQDKGHPKNITSEKQVFNEDVVLQLYDGKIPSCKICDKRFASLGALYTHDKLVHLREESPKVQKKKSSGPSAPVSVDRHGRYPCGLCDQTYSDRSNLSRHNKRKHSKINDKHIKVENTPSAIFKCDTCGKELPNSEELASHKSSEENCMKYMNSLLEAIQHETRLLNTEVKEEIEEVDDVMKNENATLHDDVLDATKNDNVSEIEPSSVNSTMKDSSLTKKCDVCNLEIQKGNFSRHIEGGIHKELALQKESGFQKKTNSAFECSSCNTTFEKIKNFGNHLLRHTKFNKSVDKESDSRINKDELNSSEPNSRKDSIQSKDGSNLTESKMELSLQTMVNRNESKPSHPRSRIDSIQLNDDSLSANLNETKMVTSIQPKIDPPQPSNTTSSKGYELKHCGYCNLDVTKQNYSRHIEALMHKELAIQCILGQDASRNSGYQCRYCKVNYPKQKGFDQHIRSHKNSIEELFNNTVRPLGKVESDKSFVNEISDIAKPLEEDKSDVQEPSMSEKLVEAINGNIDEQFEMVQCDKCNKYFANGRNLNIHMKTHVDNDQSESKLMDSSIPDLIMDAKRQIGY